MRNKLIYYALSSLVLILSAINPAFSLVQEDSLSLKSLINELITTHPSIKEANEVLNTADAKINLAKTGYFPDVNLNASYVRIGPVIELTFPGLGTFKMNPENNYNAALEVRQPLYDFGKTNSKVENEKESKVLSSMTIEQMKQKMSLVAINTFFNLFYLQEAIKIKDEQIKTLNEHLDFVQKKFGTGSATSYEILSTQVRISNAESQKLDLQSGFKIQLSLLNSFLGLPPETQHNLKEELTSESINSNREEYLKKAYQQRDEILIAKEKQKTARMNYNMLDHTDNPNLNFIGTAGYKNGYVPDLNQFKANYAVGFQFSYPLFDAQRTKNNLAIAQTVINTNDLDLEVIQRTITNEVVENQTNFENTAKKIKQFEMQFQQAEKALNLAKTSFQNGVITNLDLLDAETSFSESKLLLLKAHIDYTISYYKLKASIGERLY